MDAFIQSVGTLQSIVTSDPDSGEALAIPNLPLVSGISQLRRFEAAGGIENINGAISALRQARRLLEEKENRDILVICRCLEHLAMAYLRRYELKGDIDDLNNSISNFEENLRRLPNDNELDIGRGRILSTYGYALTVRYGRFLDPNDGDAAISIIRRALTMIPSDVPARLDALISLGTVLVSRLLKKRDLGENVDADEAAAISTYEDAIQLASEQGFEQSRPTLRLCNVLTIRFNRNGDMKDINRVIDISRGIYQPHSDDPSSPSVEAGRRLGLALLSRAATKLRRAQTVDDALRAEFIGDVLQTHEVFQRIYDITPSEHPDKAEHLRALAHSHEVLFLYGQDDSIQSAISAFSSVARSPGFHPEKRFAAASEWAQCVRAFQDSPLAALEAYKIAMGILPQLTWLGSNVEGRYRSVVPVGRVVRDATATAIQAGKLDIALEWLEQGRSVIWSQILQLRSPVEEVLRKAHPELVEKFEEISRLLDDGHTKEAEDLSLSGLHLDDDVVQARQPSLLSLHKLALEREQLLDTIRTKKGFETFLLPRTVKELLAAAKNGHIVLLNVSQARCDALLLSPDSNRVRHIPLQGISSGGIEDLRRRMGGLLKKAGRDAEPGRWGRPAPIQQQSIDPERECADILRALWVNIVKPVLKIVGFTTPMDAGEFRRIWWCPSGPLTSLPIHASGIYGVGPEPEVRLSDFAISSYIPSISALLNASKPFNRATELRILLVGQSASEGLRVIRGTLKEIKNIREKIQGCQVTVLSEKDATAEAVAETMREAQWVHFACHGIQEPTRPTESSLMLAGTSKLTLASIIRTSSPDREFAFPSACQTAAGADAFADEVVHLAAGMLLAGYKSVIATMWSIDDKVGAEVAAEVYDVLFENSGGERRGPAMPDYTSAAQALHRAVEKIRCRQPSVSLLSWVPFVHVGC